MSVLTFEAREIGMPPRATNLTGEVRTVARLITRFACHA